MKVIQEEKEFTPYSVRIESLEEHDSLRRILNKFINAQNISTEDLVFAQSIRDKFQFLVY